jgi:aspartate kinase
VVHAEADPIERINVRGISHTQHEAKLTLRRVPDRPGTVAAIFSRLAAAQINVDVIVQNVADHGRTDISFTTGQADLRQAEALVREAAETVGAEGVEVDAGVGKVSIVGVGMMSHPGVAAAMFEALREANINILMITTSEIKVTCVIAEGDIQRAVCALHTAFGLDAPAVRA